MADRVKSQGAAAAALNVAPRTLLEWERQGWWQPDFRTKQGYDIEAIRSAYPGTRKTAEHEKFTTQSRQLNQATKAIDLQLRQLALKEKSGELVRLDEVKAAISQADEGLIAMVLDLPVRLARLLPEGQLRNVMMTEGDQICRQGLRSAHTNRPKDFEVTDCVFIHVRRMCGGVHIGRRW